MNNKKGVTWAIGILLLITLISGGLLFSYIYSLRRASNEFHDLAQIFSDSQIAEKASKKESQKQPVKTDSLPEATVEEKIDMTLIFEELHGQNEDIAGWISISGTNINYPVMHTPDNPEYYLHRNFDKAYSISGVPFIDAHSSLEPRSDNILIHGHNMKNGSMFSQLLAYKDKAFLEANATIDFYTFSKKQTYDIMAVFPAEVYNNHNTKFNYHTFVNAVSQEDFNRYISSIKEASLFDTGVEAQYGDDFLTLSTCAYHTTHGRFVVIAKARNE